jgi:hypothetical protein
MCKEKKHYLAQNEEGGGKMKENGGKVFYWSV